VGNVVFTYGKGRFVEKALLPFAPTDNLVVVLLQSGGLQVDGTLKQHPTLAAVLAANTEANFTNYSRKVLSAADITVTFNTGTSVAAMDITDQTWNAAGGAVNNTLGALLVCYRPNSGSADSAILPLTKHDYAGSTTGQDLRAGITSIASDT
jgi:hypothetical protein